MNDPQLPLEPQTPDSLANQNKEGVSTPAQNAGAVHQSQSEVPTAAFENVENTAPKEEIKTSTSVPSSEQLNTNISQKNTIAQQPAPTVPTNPTVPVHPLPPKTNFKSKKPGKKFFLGCFGLFIGLFALFLVLTVITLKNNPSNSFFAQLNIPVLEVKRILSGLVNISFGLVALILLIALVISVFSMLMTSKDNKDKKHKGFIKSVFFAALSLVNIIAWIFISSTIGQIQDANASKLTGDILVFDTQTGKLMETTTNMTIPLELTFDAANVSKRIKPGIEVLSFDWDLDGDGKFGDQTGEKVTWKYETLGKNGSVFQAKMKLTVRNVDGKQVQQEFSKDMSIADVAPKIILKVDKESGEAPLTVMFDASESTDPDGQDQKDLVFAWETNDDSKFDDGNTPRITKTFDAIGTYAIKLRVQDRDKKFSVAEKIITVTNLKQDSLEAHILAAPDTGEAPLKVSFSADESKSTGKPIVEYSWNFGNNELPDKSKTTSHIFEKPGKYTVSLTIQDEEGKRATTSKVITVEGKKNSPTAFINSNPMWKEKLGKRVIEADAPLTVKFDASASTDPDNDIIEYQWDLNGDGRFETLGAKPEPYTYYDTTEVNISLKVTDSSKNENIQTVTVKTKLEPLAAIIKATPLSGTAPLTITFDGSASRYNQGSIEQYQWDFNDGTPPKFYNALIKYAFDKIGVYNVKLTIFTNDGKTSSTTQKIIVTDVPLIARFTPSIKSGVAPLSVTFDPANSTGNITKYFWDFGDGIVSTERKPSHVFTKAGTHTVVLKITSKDNITDEFTEEILVE